ncbi:hypothetical protein AAHC03_022948 [Spirometra sp. Aus1]
MLTARDDVVLTLTEDDDALPGPADGTLSRRELARRRKLALFAHFAVRSLALITYLFCSWFTTAFITPVICILTFFAVDFWLVKNVSGRLLVGLRWWNHVDPTTGKSQWLFESADTAPASGQTTEPVPFGRSRQELAAQRAATRASRLFWIGLFVFPLIWFLLLLAAILSLKLAWALVALCGCFMCSLNLYGYLRCRFQGRSGGDAGGDGARGSMLSMLRATVTRSVIADLWGSGGTTAAAPPEQPKPEV